MICRVKAEFQNRKAESRLGPASFPIPAFRFRLFQDRFAHFCYIFRREHLTGEILVIDPD